MKNSTLFFISILLVSCLSYAQEKQDFVRSSLHMHLVDDFEFDFEDEEDYSIHDEYSQYFSIYGRQDKSVIASASPNE